MKKCKIYISILLVSLSSYTDLFGQVKGNQIIQTKTFDISGLRNFEAALYADISIDGKGDDVMTITADENLFSLLDTEVHDGKMVLRQKEWIQSSQRIKIRIAASSLERVQQSVHENLKLVNLNQDELRAMAILGSVTLEGRVNSLSASGQSGNVIITDLEVDEVATNFWSTGRLVQKKDDIREIKERNEDGENYSIHSDSKVVNPDAKWIDLKIKNNTSKRIHTYVKGPKPNGKSFGYGFPMRPGQVRKERWTVGTKVFKAGTLGNRKVLVEITADDADQVVDLFN